MATIHRLPPELASQIAAGEVVERPASAVKELVENALDARATRVDVEIAGGGITRLAVSDDGIGMDEEDAQLALARHATSKLTRVTDLLEVRSYGFRGEALPSIASVSRLRLLTRSATSEAAVELRVEGGSEPVLRPAARAVGTLIEVTDLFYNVPARRKFLRASNTEAGHVTEVIDAAAASRFDVTFTLRREGRLVREWLRTEERGERARALLDDQELAVCIGERGTLQVEAYLGRPERARAGAAGLRLLVNGRPIRDRALAMTVAQAYGSVLERGRYPRGIVYLTLPTQLLDVNVHPQKTEVRFADPRVVCDALYRVLSLNLAEAFALPAPRSNPWARPPSQDHAPARGSAPRGSALERDGAQRRLLDSEPPRRPALGQRGEAPAAADEQPWAPTLEGSLTGSGGDGGSGANREGLVSSDDVMGEAGGDFGANREAGAPGASQGGLVSYDALMGEASREGLVSSDDVMGGGVSSSILSGAGEAPGARSGAPGEALGGSSAGSSSSGTGYTAGPPPLIAVRDSAPILPGDGLRWSALRFVAQLRQTYLLCEADDGFYVLDQHAAAERVTFDRLRRAYQGRSVPAQALLFPLALDVSSAEADLVEQRAEELLALGLDVRRRGEDRVSVHSVPRLVQRASPERLVRDLLLEITRGGRGFSDAIDRALATMACHGSVRAGDVLSREEVKALLSALDQADFAGHCPHGRPVVTRVTWAELERKVGRR
ncbi:MAG: DNA mismatch repair endonuclease MutL [Polyangiaceae bacterium]|nr:DNA mismatch repair endonuclease MutL [Polyangiaceae bacterium]MCW5789791.1 DNA mismatch repair endonuclease MutL [Polyangiaceae bacterium]